ncbi:MAG: DUF4783 domain-containing protein [Tannerella sp.]|nr:DUF4783 domain-containing protein [Tannerella sp.]
MRRMICMFAFMLSVLSMEAGDIAKIVNIFKEGKVLDGAGNMDSEVDIAVPGAKNKGTGADAATVLNRFFESVKPTGFTVLHHADRNETGFIVGKLSTDNGEFRVNITYVTKDNNVLMQSIRIE